MSELIEENIEFEFKSEACKNFCNLIDKFCESLSVEKNYSQHTIRNYKNDLLSFVI